MTLKEIYQALIDGKKIKHKSWDNGEFIRISESTLIDEHGRHSMVSICESFEWSIYEEPEDLDKKIEDTKCRLLHEFVNGLDTFKVHEICNLIDLKIKKAKL